MTTRTLSIVLGTLQRLPYLKRAIASIPAACGDYSFEIIVVDGGSTDGTLEFLRAESKKRRSNLRLIEQGERLGAVKAFNAGFAAARGDFVAAINDDAEYIGTPLADAVTLLTQDATIGQVAIPYGTPGETPRVELVTTNLYGKVWYANFGVIRRELGESLGWWGDYYQYGGDTELSVKVWYAGLRVAPLSVFAPNVILSPSDSRIVHYLIDDDTRVPNVESPRFRERWQQSVAPVVLPSPLAPPDDHVHIRYLGGRHGGMTYQRGGSPRKYVVDAAHPEFRVDKDDLEWFLNLRDKGRRQFERVL